MQQPPDSHSLGLTWSGQLIGNPTLASEFAAISPLSSHGCSLHLRMPNHFLPNNKANNQRNLWNRKVITHEIWANLNEWVSAGD